MQPRYTLDAASKLPSLHQAGADRLERRRQALRPELGRRLAATLPDARFELIEDARTWSMLDQPDRLADADPALRARDAGAALRPAAGV